MSPADVDGHLLRISLCMFCIVTLTNIRLPVTGADVEAHLRDDGVGARVVATGDDYQDDEPSATTHCQQPAVADFLC